MTDQFSPGARWTSKDGRRRVVIHSELDWGRDRCFMIRNLATGRVTNIEISGLTRKFRFHGDDPAELGK